MHVCINMYGYMCMLLKKVIRVGNRLSDPSLKPGPGCLLF